jgi:large subunit ribosomal protein L3
MTEQASSKKLLGKKCGMIQLFDENGALVPCTAIACEPNIVTQVKTMEKDGYSAIQLGFDELKTKDARTLQKRATKPRLGHFAKAGVPACRHLVEARVPEGSEYAVGGRLTVALFQGVKFVDVIGVSKGKGFQGVMKLYNFKGGPAAHGSGFHRHAGSIGMRTSPGRCLPGGKRPSHMGDRQVTCQNLRLVAIDEEKNLLFVEGAVPGARGGVVIVNSAEKKRK